VASFVLVARTVEAAQIRLHELINGSYIASNEAIWSSKYPGPKIRTWGTQFQLWEPTPSTTGLVYFVQHRRTTTTTIIHVIAAYKSTHDVPPTGIIHTVIHCSLAVFKTLKYGVCVGFCFLLTNDNHSDSDQRDVSEFENVLLHGGSPCRRMVWR
jgi:hypothetical protein